MPAELHPIEIEPAAVQALGGAGTAGPTADWLLLDCRTPEEHATARIAGAVLIPMQELSARVDELAAWRDKPIIVQCQAGARSAIATSVLQKLGVTNATDLIGGFAAWERGGHPVERAGATTGV